MNKSHLPGPVAQWSQENTGLWKPLAFIRKQVLGFTEAGVIPWRNARKSVIPAGVALIRSETYGLSKGMDGSWRIANQTVAQKQFVNSLHELIRQWSAGT